MPMELTLRADGTVGRRMVFHKQRGYEVWIDNGRSPKRKLARWLVNATNQSNALMQVLRVMFFVDGDNLPQAVSSLRTWFPAQATQAGSVKWDWSLPWAVPLSVRVVGCGLPHKVGEDVFAFQHLGENVYWSCGNKCVEDFVMEWNTEEVRADEVMVRWIDYWLYPGGRERVCVGEQV